MERFAWWLTIQRCSDTLEALSAAVDSLVEQKVLESFRLADGTQLFGCPSGSGCSDCEAPENV